MIFGAVIEAWIGVPAERRSLEDVAAPLLKQGIVGFQCNAPPLRRCLAPAVNSPRRPTIFIATMDGQFARVNWTRRCELARIKMEILDPDHSCIELGIRVQKFSERLRGHVAAARNRNVRMPRSELWFEPGSERGFLHALVNLEQMRMRLPDADPDNFRSAFCGKSSDANNRQKEGAELDRAEFFPQRKIDVDPAHRQRN